MLLKTRAPTRSLLPMIYLAAYPTIESAAAQAALRAADGFLFFGLDGEAMAEIDRIEVARQGDSPVLLARVRVLLHMGHWALAEALSRRGVEAFPTVEEFTVQRAFALHQMEEAEEAANAILAAPEWLRRSGILHYNLACYEARLGTPTAARRCIDTAIEFNSAMRMNAKVDPDLKSLAN